MVDEVLELGQIAETDNQCTTRSALVPQKKGYRLVRPTPCDIFFQEFKANNSGYRMGNGLNSFAATTGFIFKRRLA